jgi:hypothetical protein
MRGPRLTSEGGDRRFCRSLTVLQIPVESDVQGFEADRHLMQSEEADARRPAHPVGHPLAFLGGDPAVGLGDQRAGGDDRIHPGDIARGPDFLRIDRKPSSSGLDCSGHAASFRVAAWQRSS